jgi:hypothetical protein
MEDIIRHHFVTHYDRAVHLIGTSKVLDRMIYGYYKNKHAEELLCHSSPNENILKHDNLFVLFAWVHLYNVGFGNNEHPHTCKYTLCIHSFLMNTNPKRKIISAYSAYFILHASINEPLAYLHHSLVSTHYKDISFMRLLQLLLNLSYIKKFIPMCLYGSLEYDVDDNIIQILKLLLDNNKVPEDTRCGYNNLEQQVNTAPNHHKVVLYEIVKLIRPTHNYTRLHLNLAHLTHI